ncbi:hypothetical protein Tco_1393534 [Tanacetum coccineum]
MSTRQDNTFPEYPPPMIPIKLSSPPTISMDKSNAPLLILQKLTNHIDGTTAPSATITSGDQCIPNPAFTNWNDFDQRTVILLNSSLTEEAAAEVLGLTTAHAIWTVLLETAYSNSPVERIHSSAIPSQSIKRHLYGFYLIMVVNSKLCTFLEDGPPISDALVPESRPTDTRPSSSSPCGLCPIPTTAAEPIHEPKLNPYITVVLLKNDNPQQPTVMMSSSHGAPLGPSVHCAPTEPSSHHQIRLVLNQEFSRQSTLPEFVSLTTQCVNMLLIFFTCSAKGFKSAANILNGWLLCMMK